MVPMSKVDGSWMSIGRHQRVSLTPSDSLYLVQSGSSTPPRQGVSLPPGGSFYLAQSGSSNCLQQFHYHFSWLSCVLLILVLFVCDTTHICLSWFIQILSASPVSS